jgi:molybdate transport system substrate-binding protein
LTARPALTVFCAVALRGAIKDSILPVFTQDTGTLVDAHFAPTRILIQEITAGERPDVIIGITAALEGLDDGILDGGSLTPIAKAGIGVAVAPGAEIPDIASVEKLTGALTAARSVAYSRNGPSGIYFAKLLQDLGIAEQINDHATVIDQVYRSRAARWPRRPCTAADERTHRRPGGQNRRPASIRRPALHSLRRRGRSPE